jgi:hypothetical protein
MPVDHTYADLSIYENSHNVNIAGAEVVLLNPIGERRAEVGVMLSRYSEQVATVHVLQEHLESASY